MSSCGLCAARGLTMLLARDDAEHFLKLHRAVLCFTAEAMQGVPYQRPRSIKAFVEEHTPERMAGFRNHLASHSELIEAFALANPSGFDASDIEILRGFRHAVHGPFYVMRHLQKHSIFLGVNVAGGGGGY